MYVKFFRFLCFVDLIHKMAKLKRRKLNLQRKRQIKYSMKMGYHITMKVDNELDTDDHDTVFSLGYALDWLDTFSLF
jgi:hypothetical protein